nr:MAG TPA: hypothetical protein [Caudoviricetes sp.]
MNEFTKKRKIVKLQKLNDTEYFTKLKSISLLKDRMSKNMLDNLDNITRLSVAELDDLDILLDIIGDISNAYKIYVYDNLYKSEFDLWYTINKYTNNIMISINFAIEAKYEYFTKYNDKDTAEFFLNLVKSSVSSILEYIYDCIELYISSNGSFTKYWNTLQLVKDTIIDLLTSKEEDEYTIVARNFLDKLLTHILQKDYKNDAIYYNVALPMDDKYIEIGSNKNNKKEVI